LCQEPCLEYHFGKILGEGEDCKKSEGEEAGEKAELSWYSVLSFPYCLSENVYTSLNEFVSIKVPPTPSCYSVTLVEETGLGD
jgi:hypothetical protein